MPDVSLYERVGGMPFFERLVDRFYEGIRHDPVVGPMYPDDPADPDLAGPRRRLTLFLVQYWGGPTTYLEERGHPRLRARHFPFPIGDTARDRWLVHMRAAIDASDAGPAERGELNEYMTMAADAMRNMEEPRPEREPSA
jgi:hemoglobin